MEENNVMTTEVVTDESYEPEIQETSGGSTLGGVVIGALGTLATIGAVKGIKWLVGKFKKPKEEESKEPGSEGNPESDETSVAEKKK